MRKNKHFKPSSNNNKSLWDKQINWHNYKVSYKKTRRTQLPNTNLH